MQRRTLFVILFARVIDSLGFGILLPIIPQLLANRASPHYLLSPETPVSTGYFLIGLLMAAYPLMQFFATPVLGQLSDRYGRRPVLAISLAGTALGYAVFAYGVVTKDLWLLFIGRALDGITGGNMSVSQAVIADVSEPKDRTKYFGLAMGAGGAAFMLGPFLGGALTDSTTVSWFDAATPFWFATILSALNMLSVAVLPETNTQRRDVPLDLARNIKNLARAYAHPEVSPTLLTVWFSGLGNGLFITFMGVYLTRRFGFDESATGNFFAYTGVWVFMTQLVTTRLVAKRFGEVPVVRVTLIVLAGMIACYLVPETWWWIYVIGPFVSTSNGLAMTNLGGLLSRSARREVQGEIMGIYGSVMALALALPPLVAAPIAAQLSPETIIGAAAGAQAVAWLVFMTRYRPLATAAAPGGSPAAR